VTWQFFLEVVVGGKNRIFNSICAVQTFLGLIHNDAQTAKRLRKTILEQQK
jgi:hypothetical protein